MALIVVLAGHPSATSRTAVVLDQLIGEGPGADTRIAPAAERPLLGILDAFSESLAFRPVTVTV
ncbi:MAG: hypothetical protein ACRDRP_19835 [Pseudonocardiaceae bacterium]